MPEGRIKQLKQTLAFMKDNSIVPYPLSRNLEFGIKIWWLKKLSYFCTSKIYSDEKNIPAIGKKAQEQARFQGKNVDQERS